MCVCNPEIKVTCFVHYNRSHQRTFVGYVAAGPEPALSSCAESGVGRGLCEGGEQLTEGRSGGGGQGEG